MKPKCRPGDPPDEETQLEFVGKYFEWRSTSEPGTVFLFGAAMHLIHQAVPGYCWGDPKDPPVLNTNSGRYRLNILGAWNPETLSLMHLTGEANCDAERVILFLELVLKTYPDAPLIIIFLDNAKYFKAEIVREWLKSHKTVHLEFLPSYSPNLNLIERFWRFAKEKLVKNTYYAEYKTFRAKVFRFLNHVRRYKDDLKTLMVEKFEIIA